VKRILVVGEINVDLVFKGCQAIPAAGHEVLAEDFVVTPGSSSMICAMGLARLGNPVVFHGKLGTDTWGDYCLDALREAQINVESVRQDSSLRTGVTVSLSTPQDRALVTFPGAIGALQANEISDALLASADHLHVSSYFLQQALRPGCSELFARAHAAGLSTSLDPGFDPEEQWGADLLEALREVDLFLPNEPELRAITGCASTLEALRALGNSRTRTVVKRGRHGCAMLDQSGLDQGRLNQGALDKTTFDKTTLNKRDLLESAAYVVNAVDSTGAGDSFDAGFLHAWLRNLSWYECMRWGNACGSLSTRGVGGTTGQANADEVRALLAGVV
jgi:sugar/nucleoside kinase (ribokinase family)